MIPNVNSTRGGMSNPLEKGGTSSFDGVPPFSRVIHKFRGDEKAGNMIAECFACV